MSDSYTEWIEQNVNGTGYGKCSQITMDMANAFPSLRRVRGHYYCPVWGERAHWWLVDEDGTVIDPTAAQFPSRGMGPYVPWDESQPEPTGMCPNCGGPCYNGDTLCCQECHDSYVAYCSGISF